MLGEFIDRDTFRITRDYPHPIEADWAALTDAQRLAFWLWHGRRIEPPVGEEFGSPTDSATTKWLDFLENRPFSPEFLSFRWSG
jgi:uncharacterized protein YndB with AHSA1/START domain